MAFEGGAEGGWTGAPEGSWSATSLARIRFRLLSCTIYTLQVTIDQGDTVTWTNKDSVGHDVTGDTFKSGDPGGMQNGDTFTQTFDKKGKFDYVCTVHSGMTGSVTVN